jgi:hypothetical protein
MQPNVHTLVQHAQDDHAFFFDSVEYERPAHRMAAIAGCWRGAPMVGRWSRSENFSRIAIMYCVFRAAPHSVSL